MTNYKIVRHPHVAYDLLDIASFVADYASNDVAMRKLAEIERTIRKLRDLPHIGSFRDEIAAGVRAIPAADKGVICFIVDDDRLEVRIMVIGYAGSDWSKIVRARL